MNSILSQLLGNSLKTISNWKREKRLIITLLEKYHTKDELQEFLETGKIQKQELVKDLSVKDLNSLSKLKKQLIDEIKRTEEKLEEFKALIK
ncbi:hypothetical protein [Aliarcobacter butzleri]|uniref:hypothetical protein n=1 Tax=Aliarcobacter butzleri TaxID=28197 RepID=UPI002B24FD39|nr:hypothetical protein [Aliarcobacter butzleri]